ncbi:MAG: nitroreductase family protein [Fimbriimonadaceae bacterium]|nr:nitroreductase family protein [Fimbriimonadaceae bacterium]
MLTVTQAAEARKSIRKYTDAVIPEADLREIIRVASLAPSPWNIQPWRVIVVQDAETKLKLQEAAFGQPQVGGGSAVFVIYTDMTEALANLDEVIHPGFGEGAAGVKDQILGHFSSYTEEAKVQWGRAQGYTFMGYLLLAAQAHGYGTSPMLGFNPQAVRELFGLPEHAFLPALVSIGVPAEEGFPHHRHSVDALTRWV